MLAPRCLDCLQATLVASSSRRVDEVIIALATRGNMTRGTQPVHRLACARSRPCARISGM